MKQQLIELTTFLTETIQEISDPIGGAELEINIALSAKFGLLFATGQTDTGLKLKLFIPRKSTVT